MMSILTRADLHSQKQTAKAILESLKVVPGQSATGAQNCSVIRHHRFLRSSLCLPFVTNDHSAFYDKFLVQQQNEKAEKRLFF
jgi:hypothetical protein